MMGDGGSNYTAIAAAVATDTVLKATAGRLCKVIVIATGTNGMAIYDNAAAGSGTQIAAIPANPTAGQYFDFFVPTTLGLTVKGNGNNPAVVITWY